ncbi:MAG TPA: hypothetical protein VHD62_10910 [Opitutaceae bacterium]|nr:hypothetical protein [Opitutaceae bacterium]
MLKPLVLFLVAGVAAACANPETEVRAALDALRRVSFTWESTAHQRTTETGEDAKSAATADAAIEVTGRSDRDLTEITLPPSKSAAAVPITILTKAGAAAADTPLGWLTRSELDEALGTHRDEDVQFEGKSVRLRRCLTAAERAIAIPNPLDEAFGVLADIKAFHEGETGPVGELTERAIEKLWGDARAKSAPEIAGTVTFRIEDGVLVEYRYRLEIAFPSSSGRPTRRNVVQWTTRLSDIGRTNISPSQAALEKL